MTIIDAVLLIYHSPYTFRRTHEWRRPEIDRTGLWPLVTIGWWTWDALGPVVGPRQAELLDTLRVKPKGDE